MGPRWRVLRCAEVVPAVVQMIARCGRALHYEPESDCLRWSAGATPKPWEPWWQWKHGGWARQALVFVDNDSLQLRAEWFGQLAFEFEEAMR